VNHWAYWHVPVLIVTGLCAGLTGSITGLASLVSYPVLLAIGLGPISANVTNTVALVFSGVGSISASRPELEGHWFELRWFVLTGVLGGCCGASLLLATSSSSFKDIVPWLIGGASLAVLAIRRVSPVAGPDRLVLRFSGPTLFAVFLIAIYGGYFGAAAGVMMIALLHAKLEAPWPKLTAVRNVVLTTSNLVAAIIFIFAGSVNWGACIPLAVGFFCGGRLGPRVVRVVRAPVLRFVICLLGVGLAVSLGIQAYA
jgi:uncharacterized protein